MWAKQKAGFPSVLPSFPLCRFSCPFPFPVLFLGFVCVLFVPMFLFFSFVPFFLYAPFLVPWLFVSFCFVLLLFFPFPFIFSFLFAVCYIFPSPFLSSLFSFRSFPFFLFPFPFRFMLFFFCLPSFFVFGSFPLVYNFGETYYIILCTCFFTSLHPLLTNLLFLLHDLRRGQTHG